MTGIPRRVAVCILLASLLGTAPGATAAPVPLARAHAHNDYLHKRPLIDALSKGYTSVEADVYLVGNDLLVAHDPQAVTPERTLESLYLDPLEQRVVAKGGAVYPGSDEYLTLLVDIKSDPRSRTPSSTPHLPDTSRC